MSVSQSTIFAKQVRCKIEVGIARWKEFWFKPEDPFTLGIMRILTGWMLAYTLLVWGLDLDAFFSSNGLQPLSTIREFHGQDYVFSFLFYVPDNWLHAVHWTAFAIAVLFCCGVFTRLTSILGFLITISYSHRVPVANFGLDQILGLLCLYLAIGPSGAALSVDQWFRKRRVLQAGRLPQPTVKLESCRMVLRLIQIHLCIIYFWAGFAKLKGESWWTGEALWQVMANQEYQTLDLTWMAWVPWLPYLIAHVTVAWEVFFCVLIWNRHIRPVMLAIGTGMHFGIGAFLGMWTFGLIMTYAYFSFSSPEAWRMRLHWLLPRVFMKPSLLVAAQDSESADRGDTEMELSTALESVDSSQPLDLGQLDLAFETVQDSVAGPAGRAVAREQQDQPRQKPESALVPSASETTTETALSRRPQSCVEQSLSVAEAVPELAQAILMPNTAVLLVTAHPEERAILRRYLRGHDIPCKAATNTETAFEIVSRIKPVAIVVSGSRFKAAEMGTLIEDLADAADVPVLAVVSRAQQQWFAELDLPARFLQYPSSPREIRVELNDLLFGGEQLDENDISKPTTNDSAVNNIPKGQ